MGKFHSNGEARRRVRGALCSAYPLRSKHHEADLRPSEAVLNTNQWEQPWSARESFAKTGCVISLQAAPDFTQFGI